ncbi:MAG: squalene/phytoene synthase family protein [Candidatus Coatesbacteria bacterium]
MNAGVAKSNFKWGIRLLPPGQRAAVTAIYAFCRAADDDADLDPSRGKEAIARWREEVAACYDGFPKHPVMRNLHPLVRTLKLRREYFDMILTGMDMDLAGKRYANMDELLGYCDCVAGAVGLLVLQAMGLHEDERAREYSAHLSYGLQLTNILRDLREDADRGRVYLPADAMAAYGYSEAELRKGVASVGFFKTARFVAKRADEEFLRAREGLDPMLRRRLLGPEIMRETYEALLHRIMKAADLSLDGHPPRLSQIEKIVIATATWVHVRYL